MARVGAIADLLFAEQDRLVGVFEQRESGEAGARFRRSEWTRDGLGRGCACVLEQGLVFERGGVNVSLVHGSRVPAAVAERQPRLRDVPYQATGISLVLHPANPFAPSFHANFRYFHAGADHWWFGMVVDLTPAYGFDEDAVHFHRTLKAWCDRHGPDFYPRGKATCDEYFRLPHRDEMRGIGGVFLDHLGGGGDAEFDALHAMMVDGLDVILAAYLPILDRRCWLPFREHERSWQLLRRGRYVEFNLAHDRGTRFGLQTGGNIEAILMSLPPLASWGFRIEPEPGSPEEDTARFLRPTDWAAAG